jgi:hypothetical protein
VQGSSSGAQAAGGGGLREYLPLPGADVDHQ